jgi:exodeoxyribonuclease VII small subunit
MTKKTAKPDADALQALPFDAAMAELEALVEQISAGQLPLEELIAHYERGAALLQHCQGKLQTVEQQIKVLEAGQLKPWDAQA